MAKLDNYRECDRCNCLYEEIDVFYPNMTIILQKHRPVPGYYRFHELDLCPQCRTELYKWLGKEIQWE